MRRFSLARKSQAAGCLSLLVVFEEHTFVCLPPSSHVPVLSPRPPAAVAKLRAKETGQVRVLCRASFPRGDHRRVRAHLHGASLGWFLVSENLPTFQHGMEFVPHRSQILKLFMP